MIVVLKIQMGEILKEIEQNEENSLGSGEDFAPENDFEERNMNYEEAGNSQLFQAETVDLNDMSESSQEINPLNEDLASTENEDSPTAVSGNQDANSILEKTGGEKDKQDDVESVLAVNADSEVLFCWMKKMSLTAKMQRIGLMVGM